MTSGVAQRQKVRIMAVRFHQRARERMAERGATEQDVTAEVGGGEQFEAKFGRAEFRRNFVFKNNGEVSTIKRNRLKLMRFVRVKIGWLLQ